LAEEKADKTRVYLERVKTLEERARIALGAAAGLAGVFFTAASLVGGTQTCHDAACDVVGGHAGDGICI